MTLQSTDMIEMLWTLRDLYQHSQSTAQPTWNLSYTASNESTENLSWLQVVLIITFTVLIALFISWYLAHLELNH